jgi:serine/threonine protein kinase
MSQNEMSPFKLGATPKQKGVKRKLMQDLANVSPPAVQGPKMAQYRSPSNYGSPNYNAMVGDSQPQSTGAVYKPSQDAVMNWSPMVLKSMFSPLPPSTGYQTPPAMGSPAKTDGTPKSNRKVYRVIAANDISMVIHPPMGLQNLNDFVGKLFVVDKHYETERHVCEELRDLDPDKQYLIYGDATEQTIAVSTLQSIMSQHTDFKDAIEKEIRRQRLNHAHFKVQQLIMPYGGVSMKQITPLQPITFNQFIKYGIDILNGVEVLQQGKFVHQDIMLKNVLIKKDEDKAKLADFGTVMSYTDVFTSKNDRLQDFSLAHPPEYFVKHFQTYYNNVGADIDRKKFMKLHGYTNKEQFKEAFMKATSNDKVHSYPGKIDVYSVGMLLHQLLNKEDCVDIDPSNKVNQLKTVIKRMTTLSPIKRLTVNMARQQLEKLMTKSINMGSPVMRSPMASPYKSVITARTES